jgi:hypothetical protein
MSIDLYDEDDKTLRQFIEHLESVRNKFIGDYDEIYIGYDPIYSPDCESGSCMLEIIGERKENDKEYKKRMKKERKEAERQLKRKEASNDKDFKLYQKLKKKFEQEDDTEF